MNELQKFKVTIDGQPYTLLSDEPEERIMESINHLNTLIKEVKQKNPAIERYQAVIFAALELINQLMQFENSTKSINSVCQLLCQQIDTELSSND